MQVYHNIWNFPHTYLTIESYIYKLKMEEISQVLQPDINIILVERKIS
jgi:hypothetical protein